MPIAALAVVGCPTPSTGFVIDPVPGGVVLSVRVIPRAGRPGLAGTRDGAWLVRLAAPPVDGAANEELVHLLARTLDVPRRDVAILTGSRSRNKRVRVMGIDAASARTRLETI